MGSLLGILFTLIPALFILYALYHIIRMAVKKGIMEAYDEMNLRNLK